VRVRLLSPSHPALAARHVAFALIGVVRCHWSAQPCFVGGRRGAPLGGGLGGAQYALAVVHVAAASHHYDYVRMAPPQGAQQGWYKYDDCREGGAMVRVDEPVLQSNEARRIGTLLFIRKDCE
jgi:hypothetical protein